MNTESRSPWRDLGWLALWLVATLAVRPLLLPDEGRYAGIAFEMLHGDVFVPTLDTMPFFHKPPLLYWLDIGAMALFGANEFAVRVGPALLAWALAAAMFWHLRRWHGPQVARVGLVVLATCPFFYVGAQYVNHDIGVAACITAAVLAFVRAVDDPARTERRWLFAGWALCALGVLAKGLIGIVLPALVIGPWLLAQRRWRQLLGLVHPFGLVVFAAIALPWMGAMQWRYPGFFDYFIVDQHFHRYAETGFNNRQPFWFYIAALPLLVLPWSLWALPVLRERGARAGLYLWWVVAIVGFFSFPSSKLVGYVMPALAPVAALLALTLVGRTAAWRRTAAAAAALCLVVVGVLAWSRHGSNRDIGLALGARWHDGDRLVFADAPYYDVRFYAGLTAPAIVLSGWNDADLSLKDNWRKELHDAAAFDPARGSELLRLWRRLPELTCGAERTWIVTTADHLPQLAPLTGLETVFEGRHALLLRAGPAACTKAPA